MSENENKASVILVTFGYQLFLVTYSSLFGGLRCLHPQNCLRKPSNEKALQAMMILAFVFYTLAWLMLLVVNFANMNKLIIVRVTRTLLSGAILFLTIGLMLYGIFNEKGLIFTIPYVLYWFSLLLAAAGMSSFSLSAFKKMT